MSGVSRVTAGTKADLDAAPPRASAAAKATLGAVGVAIALWLASPILFAGHLEEITANLKMLAISANRDGVAGADTLRRWSGQFHYVTRLGVVLLLQAVDRLFGETGDAGFHALMVGSWLTVGAASIVIARR